jgi:hypothetical protein
LRNTLWLRFVSLGLLVAPAGAAEIWTDIGSQIAKFDSANPAAITYLGSTGELAMDGMDFTSDGTLYGVADQELFLINQTNGSVQSRGMAQLAPGEIFMDISWDPVEHAMYGIAAFDTSSPVHLYRINLNTAAATLVGTLGIPAPTNCGGLATTAQGARYVDDGARGGLHRLNGLAATFLGPEGFAYSMLGGMTIDWSRDGTCYHATYSMTTFRTELWTVNLNTGAGTFLGAVGIPGFLLSAAIKPVPEPAALMGMLVVVVCGLRRRSA